MAGIETNMKLLSIKFNINNSFAGFDPAIYYSSVKILSASSISLCNITFLSHKVLKDFLKILLMYKN